MVCSRAMSIPPPLHQDLHKMLGGKAQRLSVLEPHRTLGRVLLDVRATHGGVIQEVLVEVGDTVKERQPIYSLQEQ